MRALLPRAYARFLGVLGVALVLASLVVLFLDGQQGTGTTFFLLAFIWSFYLGQVLALFVLSRRLYRPIQQLQSQIERLHQKDFDQDHVQQSIPIYNQLGQALSDLGKQGAREEVHHRQIEEQLNLLIEHVSVGVLTLDEQGVVSLASQSMQAYFPDKQLEGQSLVRLSKSADLNRLVAGVYEGKIAASQEIVFYWPSERIVEVSAAPVLREGEVGQVLLLFYDVSHLRRLQQAQQDFVTNVSHELKTPVTSIKGFAETLLYGAKDDVAVRDQFLGIIHQESQRLQDIIGDILYLSRIEQTDALLQEETFSIQDLVGELSTSLSGQLKQKDLSLDCISDQPLQYQGDRGRLSQILLNLLSNAIRYTEQGGQIQMVLSETDRELEIAVADTGLGIPEHELNRIFERFYRVNKGRSRQSGGTGLGLAIVKSLLDRMGGRITVESQVGKGSRFTIYLPKDQSNT